jgi:hypothetical protein
MRVNIDELILSASRATPFGPPSTMPVGLAGIGAGPTPADNKLWDAYAQALDRLAAAIRAGTSSPDTPTPAAPTVPGGPARLKRAEDARSVLMGAKEMARRNAKNSAASGQSAPHTASGPTMKSSATKDDVAQWHAYVALLRGLLRAIRHGKVSPDAPVPPQPSVPGTQALANVANKLVLDTIPKARERARYLLTLKGGPAPTTTTPGAPPDSTTNQSTTTNPTTDDDASSSAPYVPPGTAPEGGGSYSPVTSFSGGGGGGGGEAVPEAGLPSGTLIDPATGQPAAGSLLSNKWVWIGFGAVAGAWWLMTNKRKKRSR